MIKVKRHKIFPFTKLISAHDNDITPVIQRAIGKFIMEQARVKYPNVPQDVILQQYRNHFQGDYHALALLITKEIKDYAETITIPPSGGSTQNGEVPIHIQSPSGNPEGKGL